MAAASIYYHYPPSVVLATDVRAKKATSSRPFEDSRSESRSTRSLLPSHVLFLASNIHDVNHMQTYDFFKGSIKGTAHQKMKLV